MEVDPGNNIHREVVTLISIIVGFLADLVTILSAFKDPKELLHNLKALSKRQRSLAIGLVALLLAIIALLFHSKQPPVIVTQVALSQDHLTMNVGDTATLTATVLYSDNTSGHDVLWTSDNAAVVRVQADGQLFAVSNGTATITAQAAKNNSAERVTCLVTVMAPPSGYSISVSRTKLDNYVYVHIQPYDDTVTRIRLYAKSPSGQIYQPTLDRNELYRFYAEVGVWTVYAVLEGPGGRYEATLPEDFVSFEINDISPTRTDALLAGLPVS